jgi:hypothetical protein
MLPNTVSIAANNSSISGCVILHNISQDMQKSMKTLIVNVTATFLMTQ